MIKKILVAIALAIPTFSFAQKFGTVDADAVVEAMPESKQAEEKLNQASAQYQTEFDALNSEIDKKVQEYQALAADTPQSIKDRRQQEIQELAQKAQAFQQRVQQDLQNQHAQLMQPIIEKVTNAIKSVGAEQQFTLIFPSGVSLYSGSDVIDITPMVKAKLGIQ